MITWLKNLFRRKPTPVHPSRRNAPERLTTEDVWVARRSRVIADGIDWANAPTKDAWMSVRPRSEWSVPVKPARVMPAAAPRPVTPFRAAAPVDDTPAIPVTWASPLYPTAEDRFQSGDGGDFTGGGASGSWDSGSSSND